MAVIGGVIAEPITLPSRVSDFPVLFINNQLPYGPRLEDGWSDQAPLGMVALTIAEVVPFNESLNRGGTA